ncbi:MAG: MaoC family dehydratase N-terminal domain-containing protein [Alphaproteobacteria bacterium]|jgi:3-methylfumaryl-CoA hydratase
MGKDFSDWVGRRETAEDVISPAPVSRLAATLGRYDPAPRPGDPLPPCWHWLYFLEATPRADLSPDGHARRGGFLPPSDLPRRMWAGGRLTFHKPLRVGEAARRESEILSITAKQGRSGDLLFVTVRHEISGEDGVAVTEEHDIVYREASSGSAARPGEQPPNDALWRREITPDAALLFRFSALIFNAHRIHYDREYATITEGYPGLVVHGPLTAILLLDLLRDETPGRELAGFDYQALAPLFDTASFTLAGTATMLWAERPDGTMAMRGNTSFR